MKENSNLQNKIEKLQNDYDTVCSQLRQKEMNLEDLKANLSEIVSFMIKILYLTYNANELCFDLFRKISIWMPIRMKKMQIVYVLTWMC